MEKKVPMQIFLTKRKTSTRSSISNTSEPQNSHTGSSSNNKLLKVDENTAGAEEDDQDQEKEYQQETNRCVELLINQKLS